MKDARRKFIRIGSGFLPVLLSAGLHAYRVTKDPLPTDAEIVGASMSPDMRTLMLLIESRHFDPVPPGQQYPELDPQFTDARGVFDPVPLTA